MPDISMPPDLLAALDRFISEQAIGASRTEATRRILRDWLIGNGYLSDPAGPDEAPPLTPPARR